MGEKREEEEREREMGEGGERIGWGVEFRMWRD